MLAPSTLRYKVLFLAKSMGLEGFAEGKVPRMFFGWLCSAWVFQDASHPQRGFQRGEPWRSLKSTALSFRLHSHRRASILKVESSTKYLGHRYGRYHSSRVECWNMGKAVVQRRQSIYIGTNYK